MGRPRKVTPEFESTARPVVRTAKKVLSKEELLTSIRLSIKCKNETQKKLINTIKDNDITICTGPAGTGKTFLSCYESINQLKNNNLINKIVIVKSVTTLKNEEIGFLKGSLEEKMEPFVYSFIKNFEKIIGLDLTNKLKGENIIEVLPIAYMRGINIDNAVVIIDEVQNISIDNIRTILTRLGENSKMILLGDINQIDMKYKKDSALEFLINNFKNTSNIGLIEFNNSEIIRHPLIIKIEEVFNNYDKSNNVSKANIPKPPKGRIIKEGGENIWLRKLKIFFKRTFK
jgi:phosphate starvation-inducible PhoH-like protein